MKRLIPADLRLTPDFDEVSCFSEDVKRLVAAAANTGYRLTVRDAAELWRRHSSDVCAAWLEVEGNDQNLVTVLLKHAEVLPDAADLPGPPSGYANWLDYAVDTMDTRAEELDRNFAGDTVSRQSMRDAVQAELAELRRKAGKI